MGVKNLIIPGLALILTMIGIVTLKGVSPNLAEAQAIFAAVGICAWWLTQRLNFKFWLAGRSNYYLILVLLLVVTLIWGQASRGSMRWIPVGPWFSIQGSQLAVPVIGLLMSYRLSHWSQRHLLRLIQNLILVLIPGILIFVAPDLGTTFVYLISLGVGWWLSDLTVKQMALMVAGGLVISAAVWQFSLHPYQKNRFSGFLDPNSPTNYQTAQAVIAVGSGQWWGRGVGQGVQSQLQFLPERQTDFIFASLAEEW